MKSLNVILPHFANRGFSCTFVEIFEKMSAIEIRSSITTLLDNTTDEETLDAYYQILLNLIRVQNRTVVAYDADEKPLTLQQLRQEVEAASTRVQAGRFVRHDEVVKQAENW